MNVIISGSLAYDRIMNFSEKFSDHILPDKIHNLNVCFQVNGVTENYGGTSGNIAYAMNLMGESATLSATIGSDNHNYFKWLDQNNIDKEGIKIIADELTAGAYITTDQTNNQITGFNPGAMKYSSDLDFAKLDPRETLLLVSPGNLEDMISYPQQCKKAGIDYIFDPGQSLPMLQATDLVEAVTGCRMLIVNDYEFNLILEKTGMTKDDLIGRTAATIITYGETGSTIFHNRDRTEIPTYRARQVIDPTGAGDAYRGGFVSGMIQGKDMETCGRMGSGCASFAVECNGTQVYTFSLQELEKRMNQQ
jgi:adenosine kinase